MILRTTELCSLIGNQSDDALEMVQGRDVSATRCPWYPCRRLAPRRGRSMDAVTCAKNGLRSAGRLPVV